MVIVGIGISTCVISEVPRFKGVWQTIAIHIRDHASNGDVNMPNNGSCGIPRRIARLAGRDRKASRHADR